MARLTSLAPQLLVDDLDVSTSYYRDKLGFSVDFVYEGFYAGISRDGLEIHLKCAHKVLEDRENRKANEHLDAYAGVDGIDELYAEYRTAGATIARELEKRPWGVRDFYVEDPDGYIIGFSESSS